MNDAEEALMLKSIAQWRGSRKTVSREPLCKKCKLNPRHPDSVAMCLECLSRERTRSRARQGYQGGYTRGRKRLQ